VLGEKNMSCAGYFDTLRRKAEEDSFKNQVLHEIDDKKEELRLELRNLRIEGKFHLARKVEVRLAKLEKVTERMKQLLSEAQK
jgi:hypothetical protein